MKTDTFSGAPERHLGPLVEMSASLQRRSRPTRSADSAETGAEPATSVSGPIKQWRTQGASATANPQEAEAGQNKGSVAWVNYQHGVNLAEAIEPGSSKGMTREQLLAYPEKMSAEAVTPEQELLIASTRVAPALDWAVANGVIKAETQYSTSDIHKAVSALDRYLEGMANAVTQLTSPMPMRKNYFTGTQMVSPIKGHDDPNNKKYPVALYDDKKFGDDFKSDLANKKAAYGTVIKHLLATLPLQDRVAIEQGEVGIYALREPGSEGELERGRCLIRAFHAGKTTVYEVDLEKGTVRKRNDYVGVLTGGRAVGQKKRQDGSYDKDFTVWDKPSIQGDKYQPKADRKPGKQPNNEPFFARLYTPEPLGNFSAATDSTDQNSTPQTLFSKRSNDIANSISDKLFYAKDLDLLNMAQEDPERVTPAEKEDRENYKKFSKSRETRRDFLKGFVPFWHGVESIIAGRPIEGVAQIWIDILSFMLPVEKVAVSAVKGAVRLVKSAIPPLSKFTKQMLGFTRSSGVAGIKWEGGVQGLKFTGSVADDVAKGARQFKLNTDPLPSNSVGVREIEVNGGKYFVAGKPDAGDGVHYLLRTPDPKDPTKLVSNSMLAKPNEAGVWGARASADGAALGKNRVDGWSEYFFGQEQQLTDRVINDKLRAVVDTVKQGPERGVYERGYTAGKPESINGYYREMNGRQLRELALKAERTPEEIGILVKALEKYKASKGLENFLYFKSEVESAGGTAKGMPQGLYLSEVDVFSRGECAALSNTMALAIQEGKGDVLLANLYKATAESKEAKILNFRKSLGSLHNELVFKFHGEQPVRRLTYKDIIAELGSVTSSTTLRISDKEHGVIAGAMIENNTKSFFFYDPNHGLANFPTQQAMETALESLLNSGRVGRTFKPFGIDRAMPEYDVSVFTDTDLYMNSGLVNPRIFFHQPL